MRRCVSTLLFLLITLQYCFSQNHMKFMGVPIDGNVHSFCQKLISKGFVKDKGNVQNAYCLIGRFYDEDANIQVDYDPNNNIVYSVTVYIIKNSLITAYPVQRDILKAIENKYKYEKKTISPELYQYEYYIYEDSNFTGMIQTFIVDSKTIPTTKEAMISITYTDVDNYLNYENRKRKDI